MALQPFLRESEVLSSERILQDIVAISQFHRIQGSKELVEAVNYIEEELSAWGVSSRLIRKKYDGRSWYLTLKSPIAWDLVRAEIEIGEHRLDSSRTPLVAMAHSPSGEGEGEILPILREEDWEKAEGKVVLVGEKWRKAYKKANESGAVGFIAYRKGTGNAVPYIGLFLSKDDLRWAKIPALAVPETWANEIIRKHLSRKSPRAKFAVEVEIKDRETLPILYAKIGEPPYILFTAHICHPKPGANDNASGSAMLMELARVLNRLWESSFRFGFAFLWVPEYYGTQAFIEKHAEIEQYYGVINLDMVGGSADRSGSTLMLVRTPLSNFSMLSGVLEASLSLANMGAKKSFSGSPLPMLPLKASPYEMGSDHDVFNFFGVPAVMPITWPDRFYHSSEDSPEKISRETLEIVGRGVLSAALFLAKAKGKELQRFARGYAMKYLGELAMERTTEEAEKLVMGGLARDSEFLGIELGHRFEKEPWLEWKVRGRISSEILREKDPALAEKFEELTADRMTATHLHELLMLGEKLSQERAYGALREEFGSVDEEKLKELVDILLKVEVIEGV